MCHVPTAARVVTGISNEWVWSWLVLAPPLGTKLTWCSTLALWRLAVFMVNCLVTFPSTFCQSLTLYHDGICHLSCIDFLSYCSTSRVCLATGFLFGCSVALELVYLLCNPHIGSDSFRCLFKAHLFSVYWSIQCRGCLMMHHVIPCFIYLLIVVFVGWLSVNKIWKLYWEENV